MKSNNERPIGTKSIRNKKGIDYEFEKTATGWKPVRRVSPYIDRSKIAHVHLKGANGEKFKKEKPKPEPKKYAKREIDMSQYHYVRLDSKTIVLRKKTA